ncbi:MAG: hypothetical protein CFE21_07845 [Bacteroidetes bacterium B1(2017)]|nr:MAG: hypothetical protein CFE21_07845 [Bacteroidetes bacterium B1(2017)]
MESNLAQYYTTYMQGLWIVACIFFAIGISRLILVIKNKDSRSWISFKKHDWYILATKLVFFLGLLAFLADIPVWFITVAQFRPFAPTFPHAVLVFVLYYITIQELILSLTVSNELVVGFVKRMVFFLISIFCSASFILAALIVPGTYKYPAVDQCQMLDLPVKGTWLALDAGAEKWVNYQSNYPPQKYAMDMVKLNEDGRFFINNGTDSSDFNSFGDSVFSPSKGIVYSIADGFETQLIGKGIDSINPAGNHIVIELSANKYLFLAHLKKASILVKEGDTLQSGQFIALAGNSGNTSFPHLHMHIQDKPLFSDTLALGQPYRFNTLELKRFFGFNKQENAWILRNDRFRN